MSELTLDAAKEQIKKLEGQVVELKTDKENLIKNHEAAIKTANETAATQTSTIDELNKKVDTLTGDLNDSKELVSEMNTSAKAQSAARHGQTVLTVGKKSYILVSGAVVEKKKYSKDDICKDEKLQKTILKMKQ